MEQLFNNQELLYIMTGILIAILIILLTLIARIKPKKKDNSNKTDANIETLELDDDIDSRIDIEQVIGQLQHDIEEPKLNEIQHFEDEQEEKSIISYQELLEKSKKEILSNKAEEEPINDNLDVINEDIGNEQPIKRFRNSEFISPIFGRLDNEIKYPTIPSFKDDESEEKPKSNETNIEIEKTIDLKPLQEEIQKNEDFLKMLKEFRKNL